MPRVQYEVTGLGFELGQFDTRAHSPNRRKFL